MGAGLTDVNIPESGQSLSEFRHSVFVGFHLLPILILAASLLFRMEAQVLEQDNASITDTVDRLLHFLAHAVIGEDDFLVEEFLELRNYGFKAVFRFHFTVRTAKVRHQNDSFGAMVDGVLDGVEGADNALVVGDLLLFVERDIKVDLCYQSA